MRRAMNDNPVPVPVEASQRLSKGLADAVEAIGPHLLRGQQREWPGRVVQPALEHRPVWVVLLRVVPDHVVGAGEHHAPDARQPARLHDVVRADDVVGQDGFPGSAPARLAPEVYHRVLPFEGRADGVQVGEIGGQRRGRPPPPTCPARWSSYLDPSVRRTIPPMRPAAPVTRTFLPAIVSLIPPAEEFITASYRAKGIEEG